MDSKFTDEARVCVKQPGVGRIGLLLVLISLAFIQSRHPLDGWMYTHWLFDYQQGFIKRGLLGDLVRQLYGEPTFADIRFVSYLLIFLVFSAMLLVFSRPLVKEGGSGLWLFLLFSITHSATFQHFNYDIGRFDGVIFILALLAVHAIHRWHGAKWLNLLVPLLLALSLFVHEAAFFLTLPLVLVYWYYREPGRNSMLVKALVFMGMLVLTYLISTRGLLPAEDYESHLATLRSLHGDRITENSLQVLYRGSVAENVRATVEASFSVDWWLQHLALLLVLLPGGFLFRKLFRQYGKAQFSLKLLYLSAFSPLALYPLGMDHFRWWALSMTNVLVVTAIVATEDSRFRSALAEVFERYQKWIGFLIMLSIALGPLKITSSFSF